jgi:ABC-type antimicrobial peptide transport system permease subunit
MILKSLVRRKTRTLLTMAGVAIGVAAIVALGALSGGLVAAYGSLSGGSQTDLMVAQADAIDILFSAVDEEMGVKLAGLPGVEQVTGMVYTMAATEGLPYFIVFGYEPDGFAIEHFKIVKGEPLTARSSQHGGRPLILGRTVAEDLDREVGDTVRLYEVTFRIAGIYETGSPLEDAAAVITVEDAQALSKKPRQVNAFLLKLRALDDAERVRRRIEQRFDDVTATLSSDFAESQETLAYIDGFVWAVSFLAVLIGGVGVMNTLLMSVFERTREFGTLRAVGWTPTRILALVLGEALTLCGLGGALGAAVGVALVWGVDQLPLVGGFLTSGFSAALFVRGIGVALALGLVGGAYPAWRASRLLPAEAMRAEGSAGARRSRLKAGWTALRNLLRQPTRTALTLVGIGIAIMAMVGLGGLTDGFMDAMTDVVTSSGFQLAGMEAEASMDLSAIDESVVRRIADVPGVEAAEGFLTGYAAVGEQPFFVVFGYRPRGQLIRDFEIVEGEPLTANRQVILGRVAADNLHKRVGQTMRIFDSIFRIVGIFETGVPFQDGGGLVSLRDAQKLFGQPHKVSFMGIRLADTLQADDVRFVGVRLEDPLLAETVIREIEARFPEVQISQASEFAEDVADLRYMRASTWAIAFLALLVGGAGMANTMVMSVFERTREIGVLRALGWRKRRIVWMILRESVALSVLGGVVGFLLGVVLIGALNELPYVEGFVRAQFSPALFGQALVTALVLGAVGGIYPAWRASLLRPVEALRYE